MWIKSLSSDAWVNLTHITHFRIEVVKNPTKRVSHDVVAYLDTSHIGHNPREGKVVEGQASRTVKRGTHEECEQFIKEQIGLQTAWQWLGYLVAGGIGAVLTLFFS